MDIIGFDLLERSLTNEIIGNFLDVVLKSGHVLIWTSHEDSTKKKVSDKSQSILLNKNLSQK